jgi:hypothetical protein
LKDLAVLSVEILVPPKGTVLADTASSVYISVDPATVAVVDQTAVVASAVDFSSLNC